MVTDVDDHQNVVGEALRSDLQGIMHAYKIHFSCLSRSCKPVLPLHDVVRKFLFLKTDGFTSSEAGHSRLRASPIIGIEGETLRSALHPREYWIEYHAFFAGFR